jgi:hypothetical protein
MVCVEYGSQAANATRHKLNRIRILGENRGSVFGEVWYDK